MSGYPKQATATIDMLMNSDQQFYNNLTALIIGNEGNVNSNNYGNTNNVKQLSGKMLTAAVVTLNSLALRFKRKT